MKKQQKNPMIGTSYKVRRIDERYNVFSNEQWVKDTDLSLPSDTYSVMQGIWHVEEANLSNPNNDVITLKSLTAKENSTLDSIAMLAAGCESTGDETAEFIIGWDWEPEVLKSLSDKWFIRMYDMGESGKWIEVQWPTVARELEKQYGETLEEIQARLDEEAGE